MSEWYDDDEFWRRFAPFMFDEERWLGTPAEIDALSALLDLAPQTAVLDLGCGPGRNALELARRGHQVTGVDRTEPYLEEARDRALQAGLDVEFLQADMRDFRRPESFDVAVSLFTTFGYFEDPAENARVLLNVYDSLRDGGALLIEMMGKEVLARIYSGRHWEERDGVFFLQDRRVSRDWSWSEARWIVIDGGEVFSHEFGHWLYSAVELGQMLREAGFAGVGFFGDLEGGPYDPTARRLVAVARK